MITAPDRQTEHAPRLPPRMTPEDVLRAANRWPGFSVTTLARVFGLRVEDTAGILEAAGIDRPLTSIADDFTLENVRRDIRLEMSIEAIARKYDRDPKTVRALVSHHSLRRSEIPREIPEMEERVVDEDLILDRRTPTVAPEPPSTAVVAVIAEADIPDNEPREKRSEPPKRRRRRRPEEMPTKEQVEVLLKQGTTKKRMQQEFHVAPGVLRNLLRRYGLADRPSAPAETTAPLVSNYEPARAGPSPPPKARPASAPVYLVIERAAAGAEMAGLLYGASQIAAGLGAALCYVKLDLREGGAAGQDTGKSAAATEEARQP